MIAGKIPPAVIPSDGAAARNSQDSVFHPPTMIVPITTTTIADDAERRNGSYADDPRPDEICRFHRMSGSLEAAQKPLTDEDLREGIQRECEQEEDRTDQEQDGIMVSPKTTSAISEPIVADMVRTGSNIAWPSRIAALPVTIRTIIVSPKARPNPRTTAANTPGVAAGSVTNRAVSHFVAPSARLASVRIPRDAFSASSVDRVDDRDDGQRHRNAAHKCIQAIGIPEDVLQTASQASRVRRTR